VADIASGVERKFLGVINLVTAGLVVGVSFCTLLVLKLIGDRILTALPNDRKKKIKKLFP
jgi:hypothetical protein